MSRAATVEAYNTQFGVFPKWGGRSEQKIDILLPSPCWHGSGQRKPSSQRGQPGESGPNFQGWNSLLRFSPDFGTCFFKAYLRSPSATPFQMPPPIQSTTIPPSHKVQTPLIACRPLKLQCTTTPMVHRLWPWWVWHIAASIVMELSERFTLPW